MKRVLGIDTGSTSGAACDGPGGGPVFATWYGNRWASPGEFGARLHHFDVWVEDLVAVHQPDAIAFEAPLVARGSNLATNADTVRFLYSVAGAVERLAYRFGLECFEVNVSTVKKQFTGNGRAEKGDIMFRARQFGWLIKNEHEADAAAVWFYAKASLCRGWQVPIMGARAS